MDSHPVCNVCGGKGCNKCAMGWKLGKKFEIVKKL